MGAPHPNDGAQSVGKIASVPILSRVAIATNSEPAELRQNYAWLRFIDPAEVASDIHLVIDAPFDDCTP